MDVQSLFTKGEYEMKRAFMRSIVILILTVIVSLLALTFANDEEVMHHADIFNVQATPRLEYDGYIFHLVEDAVVSLQGSRNIRTLHAPSNLFQAATLYDIANFVAPEFIIVISPNYVIRGNPMMPRNNHDAPPLSTPHAFPR